VPASEETAATRRDLVALLGATEPDELPTCVDRLAEQLISRLTVADWGALAQRAQRADGRYPGAFVRHAGYALHQYGHYPEAAQLFELADPDGMDGVGCAHLAAAAAATAWARGDQDLCRRLTDEAMELAQACGDDSALAAAWTAQALLAAMGGRRSDNRAAYLVALEHAEAADNTLARVRILNNLASADLEEGLYPAAIDRLDEATRLNDRTGHLPGLALLRHNTAEAMLGLGRLDEALLEAEASRALMARVGSPWSGTAWQLVGDVQTARGNVTQAMHAYCEAVRAAEAEEDQQALVPALAGLAVTHVADDPEAALEIIERLLDEPANLGHVPGMIAAGWIHLHSGDRRRALFYAEESAAEAARRRDRRSLGEALELAVLASSRSGSDPRLHEALTIWDQTGNVVRRQVHLVVRAHLQGRALAEQVARQQLRSLGVHDDASGLAGPLRAVREATAPEAGVRVHALGAFVVHRDGVPVASTEWPSRKARDVLKILASRGDRGISREELSDRLWPGATGTGNRLSIALSQLRGVLDPEKAHAGDHFIQADRMTVRLHPDHVACDVVEFRAASAEALEAARRGDAQSILLLEAAAAKFTGEFGSADTYDDWAIEVRDEMNGLGHEVERVLAFSLATGNQPDRALPWLARLLTHDPYDEPTYEEIIRLLTLERRHGEARRYYRTYVLRMRELGMPATPWDEFVA